MMIIFIITAIVLIVGYFGNKIVDKGEDAITNAHKRKKNSQMQGKREKLADRYHN